MPLIGGPGSLRSCSVIPARCRRLTPHLTIDSQDIDLPSPESPMSWTHGPISGGTLSQTDAGDIHITGNIDSGAIVTLMSTGGAIIIDGKVDGGSKAVLNAAGGIQIGAAANDPGNRKIDGGSTVTAQAGGPISIGGKIDGGSNATLTTNNGSITIGGKIDGSS